MLRPLLLLVGTSSTWALNASVTGGVLSVPGYPNAPINSTFSALLAAVQTYFVPAGPASAAAASNHSLVNSTLYSFLSLNGGAWVADVPLSLAPSLILVLNDVDIAPSPAFEPWRGLLELNSTHYAGVVSPQGPSSARFACSDASVSPAAIWGVGSDNLYIEGLGIYGCGRTGGGGIHLQGNPMAWNPTATGATITGNEIWNSSRAVWLETISGVSVHNNALHNCSGVRAGLAKPAISYIAAALLTPASTLLRLTHCPSTAHAGL